jgi:glycosyltransferase involved in cell wall biosynthesis
VKISVVTTYYNRPDHLRLLIASLHCQVHKPDEIVIADDGSDPASVAAMRTYAASSSIPVVIVRQEKNGFRLAAARNLAIRAACGDYLLFLDADMILLSDAISQHVQRARGGKVLCGHRGILDEAYSNHLFAVSSPTQQDFEVAWQQADLTDARRAEDLFRQHTLLRKWHLASRHKPKILGCHFSLFRNDVCSVNGFDENYVGWGYEDDDFALRLYKRGVRPESVITAARALHIWHPSVAPAQWKRHRDRPNRAYFRRWRIPAFCRNGLQSLNA